MLCFKALGWSKLGKYKYKFDLVSYMSNVGKLGLLGVVLIAGLDSSSAPQALDLPAGTSVRDEEDEDDPESIILFGQEYEGREVVFVRDRSGSMDNGTPSRNDLANDELAGAVNSLSKRAYFDIVTFSNNVTYWSPNTMKALPGNKASAIQWNASQTPYGTTCIADGAIKGLEIINNNNRRRGERVIVIGDGEEYCGGVADPDEAVFRISQNNWRRIPIDTIYIGTSEEGADMMRDIANSNGGSFTRIDGFGNQYNIVEMSEMKNEDGPVGIVYKSELDNSVYNPNHGIFSGKNETKSAGLEKVLSSSTGRN